MRNLWMLCLLSLSLTNAALAHGSSCDNSGIRVINNTDTTFQIPQYYPRPGSSIELVQGVNRLAPGDTIEFTAHSGYLSVGDALGVIELKGLQRNYDINYCFHNHLSFGSCQVGADVTTDKYDLTDEKYKIKCKGNGESQAPIMTCTINAT